MTQDELEKTGVQREGKSVYELANGDIVEYEIGFARIAFMEQKTVGKIIFAPEGVESVLGVVHLAYLSKVPQ